MEEIKQEESQLDIFRDITAQEIFTFPLMSELDNVVGKELLEQTFNLF